jgi:Spy/CpxP family protein refolding chaperone
MAAIAVLALVATTAMAQPPSGRRMSLGPAPLQLLDQKSVQEELKLADEQIKTVGDMIQKQRLERQSLQQMDQEEREKKQAEMRLESEKAIAKLLKPEQAKRLNQIHLQQDGAQAFEKPDVVKELKINDEQKAKIKQMQDAAQREMRAGGQQGGDRQEARRKMQELNKTTGDKIVSTVLTDEQKTKWKEMIGAPFKGEIRIQSGRPGG